MAVQQRIIGGGLLLAGIAVVLILIFLFTDKGMPWDEAYAKLKNDVYPRYVEADRAGDYLKEQKIAEEAMGIEKGTTMSSVVKEARADAVKGDQNAAGLVKLLDAQAFEKNLQGLYDLDGGWYDTTAHSALRLLKRTLDDATPALLDARRAARKVAETLENLRLGSGLAVAVPAAPAAAGNPIAAADAALLSILGLSPDEIRKALAAKGGGAKANSARLVWNAADAADTRRKLADALGKVPQIAETIKRAAVALGKSEQDLKGMAATSEGAKRAAEYRKAAAAALAAGLDDSVRQAFEKDATLAMIADVLRQDAKLLEGCASNAPGLGQALAGNFAP